MNIMLKPLSNTFMAFTLRYLVCLLKDENCMFPLNLCWKIKVFALS